MDKKMEPKNELKKERKKDLKKDLKKELPFNIALIQKIYFLAIIGTLLPAAQEYYLQAQEFMDHGAMEGFIYFFTNLAVMVYIGQKAFEYGSAKVQKISHLAVLFIVPLLFIDMEVETYLQESPTFIPFDKWKIYYQKGVQEYYGKRNRKATQFYFAKSIQDIKDDKTYEALINKSKLYLTLLFLEGAKTEEEKTKALESFRQIYKFLEFTPGQDRAIAAYGMAHIMNSFKRFDSAYIYIHSCLDTLKEAGVVNPELARNCEFELCQYHLVNQDFEGAKALVEKFMGGWSPDKKFLTIKILDFLDMFLEAKQFDLAMPFFMDFLERLRGGEDKENLIRIYDRLGKIHYERGEKLKGDIFFENKMRLEEQR